MGYRLSSGRWHGYYEQSGRRYPQEMALEFADGLIRGDGRDGLGNFAIDGEYRAERDEVRVGWIKTYDGAHSVVYLGVLRDADIAGTWSLHGARGAFVLAPPDA